MVHLQYATKKQRLAAKPWQFLFFILLRNNYFFQICQPFWGNTKKGILFTCAMVWRKLFVTCGRKHKSEAL
jgi:hypothetical protein